MIVTWFSFAKNFLISIAIFCACLDRQITTRNSTYTGWEVLGTEVPFNSIFTPVYDTLSIHVETKLASFSFLPNAEAPGSISPHLHLHPMLSCPTVGTLTHPKALLRDSTAAALGHYSCLYLSILCVTRSCLCCFLNKCHPFQPSPSGAAPS